MKAHSLKASIAGAAIACLSWVLVGCSGLKPVPQQQLAEKNVRNTGYTIQDLGVVGANPNQPGQPIVISNGGWISGAAGEGASVHAVLWHKGEMMDIGNPGLGGNSFGYGVNESGASAGNAELVSSALSTTEDFCGWQAMGFSASSTPCVPFIWTAGKMIPLRTLGGVNGIATQINNSGAVAGYAENASLDPSCPSPQQYQFKPVVWFKGAVHPLPTGSDLEGVALAINDSGQAAGASGSCAAFNPIWGWYFQAVHARLWTKGSAMDLGNLGGALNNFAHGINNLGQVVGSSDVAGDQTSHAFLWTAGTKMQDLGTVGSDFFSVGLGINDAGQIVGISANQDFSVIRAFVRQNGTLVDLNNLVAGNNSLFLMTACSINSRGEIIGIGIDPDTGETHGYLAIPSPQAAAVSSARKTVVLPDWVRGQLRAAWHSSH